MLTTIFKRKFNWYTQTTSPFCIIFALSRTAPQSLVSILKQAENVLEPGVLFIKLEQAKNSTLVHLFIIVAIA